MCASIYPGQPSTCVKPLFSCTDVIDYAFNSVTAQIFVIHSDRISLYETKSFTKYVPTKDRGKDVSAMEEDSRYTGQLHNGKDNPSFSSVAQIICPKPLWNFEYKDQFTTELYGISWTTEYAVVECVESINSWLCLFNRRYLKLIHNKRFYSRFIDLEKSFLSMRYLPMSNLIILKSYNRKSFAIAFVETDSFFEHKRQTTKDLILHNQPSFTSGNVSEAVSHPLLFSVRMSPKSMLHRHKVCCYKADEHLRRLFVCFENGQTKSFKLPGWEQLASAEVGFSSVGTTGNFVSLSVYQELVVVATEGHVWILEAFGLACLRHIETNGWVIFGEGQLQAHIIVAGKGTAWLVLASLAGRAGLVEIKLQQAKSDKFPVQESEVMMLQAPKSALKRNLHNGVINSFGKMKTEVLIDAHNVHHLMIMQGGIMLVS